MRSACASWLLLLGLDPSTSLRGDLHLYRTVAGVSSDRCKEGGQCRENLRERLDVVTVGRRDEDRLVRKRRQVGRLHAVDDESLALPVPGERAAGRRCAEIGRAHGCTPVTVR